MINLAMKWDGRAWWIVSNNMWVAKCQPSGELSIVRSLNDEQTQRIKEFARYQMQRLGIELSTISRIPQPQALDEYQRTRDDG